MSNEFANTVMTLPNVTSPLVFGIIVAAVLFVYFLIKRDSRAKTESQRLADSAEVAANGPIVVRRYSAGTEVAALAAFRRDAADVIDRGYSLAGQTWEQRGFSGAAYLIALILCPVLIGVPVLLFMLSKGRGRVLTATFERKGPPASSPVEDPTRICPRCAETIKAAALACRYCGQTLGQSI
ncbi:MAG: hypothetical protein V4515_08240 [Chloroflexota bacterium]